MNKNTGYRQMLRDRCPKVVSYALKWCKAKEKWLDYVYKNQIWPLSSKKERLNQTKLILGIQGNSHHFDFYNTICWKDLTPEEVHYWKYVCSWVDFFRSKYMYIENAYAVSIASGKSIRKCKFEMMKKWLIDFCPKKTDSEEEIKDKTIYVNNLADFLIDCFEGNIQ